MPPNLIFLMTKYVSFCWIYVIGTGFSSNTFAKFNYLILLNGINYHYLYLSNQKFCYFIRYS